MNQFKIECQKNVCNLLWARVGEREPLLSLDPLVIRIRKECFHFSKVLFSLLKMCKYAADEKKKSYHQMCLISFLAK